MQVLLQLKNAYRKQKKRSSRNGTSSICRYRTRATVHTYTHITVDILAILKYCMHIPLSTCLTIILLQYCMYVHKYTRTLSYDNNTIVI